jgi:hypothetical protein
MTEVELKSKSKQKTHTQNLAISKKSTLLVQSSLILVKYLPHE